MKNKRQKKDSPEDKKHPHVSIEVNRILLKSKDLLRQLPASHFNSLHYLIAHLRRVVDHAEENKMNSKNLGVIFGPTLIRPRPTTAPVTISSLAEYSNQARLVEFLITYSQKIFDGSLQPQAVVISNTGAVAPQVDQGYLPKPLLSPDERDTDHSMKPLFFSSKEDIRSSDCESKSFELTTSFEESERRQNALGKCDAPLLDNKVHLLFDQEHESASQKMEDVCKSPKLLLLKSNRAANSVQRHTPRTKMRPVSLPVDRLLLLASSPTERSSRDVGNVDSDKFGKNPAFEGLHRKDNSNTTRSKVNGFDQQNVQKSWDTQYVRNNFTAKTTMIVPSAYPEKGLTVNTGNNRDHPGSKAHAEPARAAGDVSERRSSDSCPATAVRAPRTLQPQHWTTFYKPPNPTFSVRGTEEKTALPSIAVPPVLVHAPQIHVTKSDPDSEATLACPVQTSGQPKESSEEPALPEGTPTCQRPRLKRMQQFEDLEDEIPQFV